VPYWIATPLDCIFQFFALPVNKAARLLRLSQRNGPAIDMAGVKSGRCAALGSLSLA
jgi:hypothetical protein